MTKQDIQTQFTQPLLAWYDVNGRKDLPWQLPRHPYRVWVSEIMLQQTQVQTVIPYFNRFVDRFPTVNELAQAAEDEVLSLWSGLGYYSRARNLHSAAKLIKERYQGIIPEDLQTLLTLPGIGPSTAAAILSQAFNQPTPILDGNVKRVLTRYFLIKGWTEQAQVKKTLWEHADLCMSGERCADYTQAIMDLGATCCTSRKPDCIRCPLNATCLAYKNDEQSQYPTKKIKKPVPVQHQQFLVLHNKHHLIYLEKRPPTGLWGGLWCLPSLNVNECPITYIERHYALKGINAKPLMSFKHRFSHFHLEINAMSIQTQPNNQHLAETSGSWFSKEHLASLGLAKPTSLILAHLFDLDEFQDS
ncbi:A/G-specific adenine glycosylase [Legionella worsleiensis]|uniref:Adenine DNA glycosylase n=1 Tax=Legionella worsleiensis TaxID=45076 RepID=A0A0W1A4S3_9GAMM|nr:A/G-specific adenine glycosylase [Legionella worsleiensis]KTD76019.1 A/G specific adenine glycosylase [Legionella worsleiensis]STY33033.1 A/G-specific adenine glycosylase [Legionella worsleiensis]